jgi:predicted TIM-barrel fold metal-dependent hydrolase
MTTLDFSLCDADNHYYEARDAFTRHADPKMAARCMQWANIGGKERLLVGGKVQRFIANPTFDPVARPGCLDDYHRGRTHHSDIREAFGALEPLSPAYQNREARLAVMDSQGVERAILFPTLGVGMEEFLKEDIDALHHAFSAFNSWLHEDWGYAHRERIFAAPVIPLADPAQAVKELERALERDARVLCIRMAPAFTADGPRSIGDRIFDPFWGLAAEAGVVAAFHTGDSGYTRYTDEWEPVGTYRSFMFTAFRLLSIDRAVYDTFAALLCHGVFTRHPRLRALSVENGAAWVSQLFENLRKVCKTQSGDFEADPIETFKRHVSVSPFQEDDLARYIDLLGPDRVVLGSDWPHAEGLSLPGSFIADIHDQPPSVVRRVMRENTFELTQRLS